MINNIFKIQENYPNLFLYGFKKNNIPHIIQFSLLNPKLTVNVWEVKIVNINKINEIEHGREIQFTESDPKSNNDFINMLEFAFDDFFNNVKIKPKAFVFHLPYKITFNNINIFNTKIKHILLKHFHFKYNQHSFESDEHKWIYFSLIQSKNIFKIDDKTEIEDTINYLYDNYIQFRSPINISKLINKEIILQFQNVNKTNDMANSSENWKDVFEKYDQGVFKLFSNIIPFKFLYTNSNGIGRFIQNYLLDYSQLNNFNIFTSNITKIFDELNLKYNEDNLDIIEQILENLNSIQTIFPKNNLLNWFISYYTELTTNLGFKNQTIFITSLFVKSSDLLIPHPEEILEKKDKDLSYQFYYNANPFKFNKITQTENPVQNILINKNFNINFLSDNFEKKIIEYKDNVNISNIEDYILISKIFKFFIESIFFPNKVTEIFSNKDKTEYVLEHFKNINSYSLGSVSYDYAFNGFCLWMNKLNIFIKNNKDFNINNAFFFNSIKQLENINIFEIIDNVYKEFKYKEDWNLSENVNYLIPNENYLEFFYGYEDTFINLNPYFENLIIMKNSKSYFDEWFDHLFSTDPLKNLNFNNYEDRYNFLINEFNKSKMTDTSIKNILDFNYYIKYIFNDQKYTKTILPQLQLKDGIPILNNIKFIDEHWDYYISKTNTILYKIFHKLLNSLSIKLNISIKTLLSGIDNDSEIIKKINGAGLEEFYEKIKIESQEYYINIDDDSIESFKEVLISNITNNDYFSPIEVQNRDIDNINSGNITQFIDKKTLTKEEARNLFIRLSLWLFQDDSSIRNISFGNGFYDTTIKKIPDEFRNKIDKALSEGDKKELTLIKVMNSKIIDSISDIELSQLLKKYSNIKDDNKQYYSELSKIQLKLLSKYKKEIRIYTGAGYLSINNDILRHTGYPNDDLINEYFSNILSIYEAYHQSSSLSKENIITYRGTKETDKPLYNKMAGDYLIESGFLSTSINKEIAIQFSDKEYGNVYIFYLPKETPLLYLTKVSTHKNEDEILLPLGSVFKIISIENRRNLSDSFQSLYGGFLYRLVYIGNIGSKILSNIINKSGTEKKYQQRLDNIISGKFLETSTDEK